MKYTLLVVLAMILAGTAGFYGGLKYQQSRRNTFFVGEFGRTGSGRMMLRNGDGPQTVTMSNRPVTGEILDVSKDTLTIKMDDGSSKLVLLNNKTQIRKAEIGTLTDLVKGKQVMVIGTENSDGSVSANNIQLNLRLTR